MPWVPLDDEFGTHRKVVEAGNEAVGLHCRSMSWSAANLTNGHVSHAADDMLAGRRARQLRDKLLAVALRDPCAEHRECTVVHDWPHYNNDSEHLARQRALARERQQRKRAAKQSGHADVTRDSSVTPSVTSGVTSRASAVAPVPISHLPSLGSYFDPPSHETLRASTSRGEDRKERPCTRCDGSGWIDPEAEPVIACPECRPHLRGVS